MKKINFEFLELKSISGKSEVANVKEMVSEQIYSHLGGLKWKLLAEKIYKSPSPCELDDTEAELLQQIVTPDAGFFSNKLSDALRELLEKGE